MSRGYIIPDREDMERSVCLAGKYGCAFEYNDFFKPEVLDNPKKQEEIINFYAKYRSDFSEDTMGRIHIAAAPIDGYCQPYGA